MDELRVVSMGRASIAIDGPKADPWPANCCYPDTMRAPNAFMDFITRLLDIGEKISTQIF